MITPFHTFPWRLIITGWLLLLTTSLLAQTIRYVKTSGTNANPNSATSWASATNNLAGALAASQPGDQVWVAQGLYKPTATASRAISFTISSGIAVYGGFVGNETALAQRQLTQPLSTTLSGDIGTPGNPMDNTFHIVQFKNASAATRLDGFLLIGGNADGNAPNERGAAIYNDGNGPGNASMPQLINLQIMSNRATYGGAIYNTGDDDGNSSPSLINVSLTGNAASYGGAVYNNGNTGSSNPRLTNVSFSNNTASVGGGALYNDGTSGQSLVTLVNGVVFGNGGSTSFAGTNASLTATYSLLESSVSEYTNGTGNLTTTTSPFASTTATQLAAGSLAIDAGDPATTTATVGLTDLAGNPRFVNTRIDMGAYEFQTPLSVTAIASLNRVCAGSIVTLSAMAQGNAMPYSYSWVAPASTSLSSTTASTVSATMSTAGVQSFTIRVGNATGTAFVSQVVSVTVVLSSARLYVRQPSSGTVNGANTGLSWADAFTNLQDALNYGCGPEVWVASGVYKPTSTTDRAVSFSLTSGITVYGGFVGNETALMQRKLTQPLSTTLSGDINNDNTLTGNSYHVVQFRYASPATRLDGFVITGGNANGTFPDNRGGGIYNDGGGNNDNSNINSNSHPYLANLTLVNNIASSDGELSSTMAFMVGVVQHLPMSVLVTTPLHREELCTMMAVILA